MRVGRRRRDMFRMPSSTSRQGSYKHSGGGSTPSRKCWELGPSSASDQQRACRYGRLAALPTRLLGRGKSSQGRAVRWRLGHAPWQQHSVPRSTSRKSSSLWHPRGSSRIADMHRLLLVTRVGLVAITNPGLVLRLDSVSILRVGHASVDTMRNAHRAFPRRPKAPIACQ